MPFWQTASFRACKKKSAHNQHDKFVQEQPSISKIYSDAQFLISVKHKPVWQSFLPIQHLFKDTNPQTDIFWLQTEKNKQLRLAAESC